MKSISRSIVALALVALASTAPAATVYTVNQAGGGDFTQLSACITAINASADTAFTVNFTDAAAVTYDITAGGDNVIANGKSITMSAATAGIINILGRMTVSNGGGTFTATNITFKTSGQWCALHAYDGLTLTNCIIGPCNDNGLVIRGGGNNVLTNCQFTGIPNNNINASGGMTNVNNCTWTITATDNGRCVGTDYIAAGPADWATQRIIVNGGSCTTNQFNRPFVISGFNLEVNNFTCTGGSHPILRDWESGPGVGVFNNCQFLGGYDRTIYMVQNADKPGTITLNRCLIQNRADTTADVAVIETRSGGSGTIALFANDTVFQGLNATANGTNVVVWGGGKIGLSNCVLDGKGLGTIVNDAGIKPAQLDLDHCIVLNTKVDVLAVSESPTNTFSFKNTIIDESNVAFGDVPATSTVTKLIDHNVINVVPVPSIATNTSTGDPKFVDRATGNYRIMAGSSCAGKGVPTTTLLDIDDLPYDLVKPDIGYFQLLKAKVHDWSVY